MFVCLICLCVNIYLSSHMSVVSVHRLLSSCFYCVLCGSVVIYLSPHLFCSVPIFPTLTPQSVISLLYAQSFEPVIF